MIVVHYALTWISIKVIAICNFPEECIIERAATNSSERFSECVLRTVTLRNINMRED